MVFFDKAPPGRAGKRMIGTIQAVFVREGITADSAIEQHLIGLKKQARNVTVVSTDKTVRASASARGAAVVSSDEFARELTLLRAEMDAKAAKARGARRGEPPGAGGVVSPARGEKPASADLDADYELFNIDPAQADRPIDPSLPKKKPPAPPKKSPGTRRHHGFPEKK
jgi:hypothetical protein